MREILQAQPFCLSDSDIDWVATQKAALTGSRRLAQLFNVMLDPGDAALMQALHQLQPGAVTQFTTGGLDVAVRAAQSVMDAADVPVLISGDVEGGSIRLDGTTAMPNQLGMAALPQAQDYEQALSVMLDEARAVGIDWAFAPVLDINADFRSTIVGTRSFGSSPHRVSDLGSRNIRLAQARGMAATAKHWPGEGFDARDQHVVTTINPLSVADWHATFGVLFKRAIDEGVKTVMAGHIAFPAYARSQGETGIEAFRPASISRHLCVTLLRQELGFNGLLVSDATPMAGLSGWSPRAQHLPEIIENGCDMILFTPNLAADVALLEQARIDGRLSEQRIDDALTRVLGLKASLGLHRRPKGQVPSLADIRSKLQTPAHVAIGQHAAAASVTLVKDVGPTLPLNLARHRRITLITETSDPQLTPFAYPDIQIGKLLAAQGFEVTPYSQDREPTPDNTDLMLYVLAHESLMTSGAIFFDWRKLHGPMWHAMRRTWHDIPHVLVSLGHPYYLHDAPRMPCVVNAYTSTDLTQQAVVRKLLGQEPFEGVSPVDAFCGHEDARY